jgi:hypothetical protein
MRAETINHSWWNSPIGYNVNCNKTISEWKREHSQNIIRTMTPVAAASVGTGIIGIFLSFLGFSNDKKNLGFIGLLGCIASVCGFIYDIISTNKILADESKPALSRTPDTSKEQRDNTQSPKNELILSAGSKTVSGENPFFINNSLCTNNPDVLIVDIYHGILSGDVKKIQDVINRIKKLELEKIKPLLNNKLQEVRVVAVLSLISRDDYDSDPNVKQILIELAKKDPLVLKTIRNLTLTEADNKITFDRLVSLLASISS